MTATMKKKIEMRIHLHEFTDVLSKSFDSVVAFVAIVYRIHRSALNWCVCVWRCVCVRVWQQNGRTQNINAVPPDSGAYQMLDAASKRTKFFEIFSASFMWRALMARTHVLVSIHSIAYAPHTVYPNDRSNDRRSHMHLSRSLILSRYRRYSIIGGCLLVLVCTRIKRQSNG